MATPMKSLQFLAVLIPLALAPACQEPEPMATLVELESETAANRLLLNLWRARVEGFTKTAVADAKRPTWKVSVPESALVRAEAVRQLWEPSSLELTAHSSTGGLFDMPGSPLKEGRESTERHGVHVRGMLLEDPRVIGARVVIAPPTLLPSGARMKETAPRASIAVRFVQYPGMPSITPLEMECQVREAVCFAVEGLQPKDITVRALPCDPLVLFPDWRWGFEAASSAPGQVPVAVPTQAPLATTEPAEGELDEEPATSGAGFWIAGGLSALTLALITARRRRASDAEVRPETAIVDHAPAA